jgi:hypothetical protein
MKIENVSSLSPISDPTYEDLRAETSASKYENPLKNPTRKIRKLYI